MKRSASRVGALLTSVVAATLVVPTAVASTPTSSESSVAAVEAAGRGHGAEASWVGSWAAAMTPAGAAETISGQGFTDTTLRQSAHLSVGGDSVRIRISNDYGTTPLVVGSVTVAPGTATAQVDPQHLQPVTFDGSSSVTIPAGAEWVSDPVPLHVADNSDLVVSMYLPGPTGPATVHPLGRATSYHAPGDATSAATDAFAELDTSRYFLEGVDVTSGAQGSVVFFGDSITDGYASSVDENLRYPDQVADRLLARPDPRQCGVLNAGISGNRVLTDAGTAGVSALARFEDDVLDQTAVRSVVLLEGINDIGRTEGALEPEELIGVYRQFIERAHDHGIRVIGATITPYEGAGYYTEAGEADRQAVNSWIRTSGEFDDVVDFDAAVRDPQNPSQIRPEFDPGDHLHPNDAGYAEMAAAIDLKEICSH